ncbi:3804_t:CDS:1, partial [Acaulospora colombiana]
IEKRAADNLDFTDLCKQNSSECGRDYYPLLNQREDPLQMPLSLIVSTKLAFEISTTPTPPSDSSQTLLSDSLSSTSQSSPTEIVLSPTSDATDQLQTTETQSSPEQVPSAMPYRITGSAETLRTEKGNVGMVALAVTILTLVFW